MMSGARKLVIAIDGPAGSGKSTIAARLAKKLGYVNLESGAMYRALALKALEQQVSLEDPEALRALAAASEIQLEPQPDGNRVLLAMFRNASARVTSLSRRPESPFIRRCARSWSRASVRWAPTVESLWKAATSALPFFPTLT
jgi:hypothetical protein